MRKRAGRKGERDVTKRKIDAAAGRIYAFWAPARAWDKITNQSTPHHTHYLFSYTHTHTAHLLPHINIYLRMMIIIAEVRVASRCRCWCVISGRIWTCLMRWYNSSTMCGCWVNRGRQRRMPMSLFCVASPWRDPFLFVHAHSDSGEIEPFAIAGRRGTREFAGSTKFFFFSLGLFAYCPETWNPVIPSQLTTCNAAVKPLVHLLVQQHQWRSLSFLSIDMMWGNRIVFNKFNSDYYLWVDCRSRMPTIDVLDRWDDQNL